MQTRVRSRDRDRIFLDNILDFRTLLLNCFFLRNVSHFSRQQAMHSVTQSIYIIQLRQYFNTIPPGVLAVQVHTFRASFITLVCIARNFPRESIPQAWFGLSLFQNHTNSENIER